MPERTADSRATRHRIERFRRALWSPARHPRKASLVVRDALLIAIASFVAISTIIWDPLVADLMANVLPAALVADRFGDIAPWDFLVYRANAAAVVGGLVGSARVGVYYWHWRRRRGTLPDRWEAPLRVAGFLAVGGALFVAATVGSYQFLVPRLAELVATAAAVPPSAVSTHPYVLAMHVLILCLSCGVASVLAYVLATLTLDGIASFETTVIAGAVALVAALAFGHVAWPLGRSAAFAWASPLVGGYGVGVVLALVGTRLGRSGDTPEADQQDE